MTDSPESDSVLEAWVSEVRDALGIEEQVDIRSVLGLAGVAAHAVLRPAAPLTTYLVGFAAGRAAANGGDAVAAAEEATRIAKALAAARS